MDPVRGNPRLLRDLVGGAELQGRRVPRARDLLIARVQVGVLPPDAVPDQILGLDRLLRHCQLVEHVRVVLLLVHEEAVGYLLLVELVAVHSAVARLQKPALSASWAVLPLAESWVISAWLFSMA